MNFTPVIEFFLVMSIFFLYQRVEEFITHTHIERDTERERERRRGLQSEGAHCGMTRYWKNEHDTVKVKT